jgi:hypothetical protein
MKPRGSFGGERKSWAIRCVALPRGIERPKSCAMGECFCAYIRSRIKKQPGRKSSPTPDAVAGGFASLPRVTGSQVMPASRNVD